MAPVAVVLVARPMPLELGKAELKSCSKAQLEEMAHLLETNKTLKVLIVGHTDNRGSVEANQALSQRPAESVVLQHWWKGTR